MRINKEDHTAFLEIASPERISAFGIENDEHSYAEKTEFANIVDNVYIRQFMSSANILETMMKITKSFDEVAGTEFTDNILFSLK